MNTSDQRRDYQRAALDEGSVAPHPMVEVQTWLAEAIASATIDEAYAMTLSTVGTDGCPSSRIVLAREIDTGGVVFYTNYNSRKGRDINHNPAVALVFYWGPLERQIRIEGRASRVAGEVSDRYFAGRPHRSKLGALVSHQSQVVSDRTTLDARMAELVEQYPEGSDVPRPEWWGGYRVAPLVVELWQGRRSRLHDRVRYRLIEPAGADDVADVGANARWTIDRLSP